MIREPRAPPPDFVDPRRIFPSVEILPVRCCCCYHYGYASKEGGEIKGEAFRPRGYVTLRGLKVLITRSRGRVSFTSGDVLI